MNDESNFNDVLDAALQSRYMAYAPYSKFQVGAAVETTTGAILAGGNVENSVYGLGICAERVALAKSVSFGFLEFVRIVIVAHPLASPCGACRQFMAEFGPSLEVIAVDAVNLDSRKVWKLAELLPDQFKFDP